MPTTVAATGNIAIPLKLTADLLAACATFQTLVGAANATAALQDIWEGEARNESLPRAIVDWGDYTVRKNALTNWMLSGDISVLIEKEITRTAFLAGYQDEGRTFRNQMGAIQSEMISALISSPNLYPDVQEIVGPIVILPEPDDREGKYLFVGWMGLMVEGSAL